MIVDLHAHYPMHLVPGDRADPLRVLVDGRARLRLSDRIRALLVGLASRVANYRTLTSGPGMTVKTMRAGDYGVALSVLYSPFDEVDPLRPFGGAPPRPGDLDAALRQAELVESRVAAKHGGEARVVHSPAELDAALADGELALVHAVEGGFHIGPDPAAGVERLADLGVAYVTLAHLVFRGVAANANALPFLPDHLYHLLYAQPRKHGLTDHGREAVRAMAARGVLVDVTHMSEAALHDTFTLLDEVDPAGQVPVLASHMACRFGSFEYNLTDEAIAAVGRRGGVLGVIACDHFARRDGRHRPPPTWEGTLEAICRQIDHVHEVTGSHDHAAIGTDIDGYIKPMLHGLDDASKLSDLEAALVDRYGLTVAEQVCSGNALRVLRTGWRGTAQIKVH